MSLAQGILLWFCTITLISLFQFGIVVFGTMILKASEKKEIAEKGDRQCVRKNIQ
jgi:hypothetical protein